MGACVHIHIKHRSLKRFGQNSDTWSLKVMVDKYINGLATAERVDIRLCHPAVPSEIKT